MTSMTYQVSPISCASSVMQSVLLDKQVIYPTTQDSNVVGGELAQAISTGYSRPDLLFTIS
jgi:hypothetical protein